MFDTAINSFGTISVTSNVALIAGSSQLQWTIFKQEIIVMKFLNANKVNGLDWK